MNYEPAAPSFSGPEGSTFPGDYIKDKAPSGEAAHGLMEISPYEKNTFLITADFSESWKKSNINFCFSDFIENMMSKSISILID
jgi:hypothetical protein